MKSKKPVVRILFDKRNLKEGTFSVKLAVYFNGVQKLFPTGLVLDQIDVAFLKVNKDGLSAKYRDGYKKILWHRVYGEGYTNPETGVWYESHLMKGVKAAASIEDYFSFEIFARVLAGDFTPENQAAYPSDLLDALSKRAVRLKDREGIGSSQLFESTQASFKRFAIFKKVTLSNSPKLPFQIVTPSFLKEYEKWMLKFGKAPQRKDGPETPASITTIAMYCRNVRTIFNEAIDAGVITIENYPFSKKSGFRIPKANNKKKALSEDVILAIMNFPCKPGKPDTPGSEQEKARDLWIFSYLCNGLNFTDICSIKQSDVNFIDGSIEIYRSKTKDTKREEMDKIKITLSSQTIAIIQKWGTSEKSPNAYLFPFIDNQMSLERKKAAIKQVIKNTNYHLNQISAALGLEVKINTYEARHTFATTLLRSEVPLAFISQSLGHTSISTTQAYLGSFESEQTKKYLSVLIPKQKEEAGWPTSK